MGPVCEQRNLRLRASAGLCAAVLTVLSVGARAACEPGLEIVTNPGRHGPYYHLCLGLRAAMVDFGSSDRETHAGGQFEVRVERDSFPVAAPACRGAIILRMPWTALQKRAYEAKVSAKRRLLARIRALEESREALLPVAIELNPYMRVLSRGPAVIELTGCNVFFRHADGGYVDHLQPWMRVP